MKENAEGLCLHLQDITTQYTVCERDTKLNGCGVEVNAEGALPERYGYVLLISLFLFFPSSSSSSYSSALLCVLSTFCMFDCKTVNDYVAK